MHTETPLDLVRRIVEAALFAAAQPQSLDQLAALFPDDAPAPADSIEQALQALRDEAPQRGVELVEVASGFRFQVRAEVQPWVARLWADRQTRYSRALLETLALVAYRQPITRGEIEQIRGVAVSTQMIRTLEEREWVRVVGHRDVPGKPALYGTTRGFLDYFGLKSLDQLPPLTELHEIPDLEPQLQLEPVLRGDGADVAGEPSRPIEPLPDYAIEAEGDAGPLDDDDELAGPEPSDVAVFDDVDDSADADAAADSDPRRADFAAEPTHDADATPAATLSSIPADGQPAAGDDVPSDAAEPAASEPKQ